MARKVPGSRVMTHAEIMDRELAPGDPGYALRALHDTVLNSGVVWPVALSIGVLKEVEGGAPDSICIAIEDEDGECLTIVIADDVAVELAQSMIVQATRAGN